MTTATSVRASMMAGAFCGGGAAAARRDRRLIVSELSAGTLSPLAALGSFRIRWIKAFRMEVRMDLARIIISDTQEQQIIVLRERDGERQFSIVIGDLEAQAIRRRISGIRSARPLTHDLLASVIEQ